MRNPFREITLCCVIMSRSFLFAQEETTATPTPITVPSSPEVSALNKYGEIPVSHFSGVPNISVPVFTIQEADLQIPIEFKYHAGGFKVDEMASEVGLGWSLNAGGMISRSIQGKADEGGAGAYHTIANQIDVWLINSNDSADKLNKYDNYDQMNKISTGTWNLQPDVFSFNMLGKYQGQFIIDYNGDIFNMPSSKVKIIPPTALKGTSSSSLRYGAASDEWVVITNDGMRFYFGGNLYEEQTSSISTESSDTYISSWVLNKVISPMGQVAEFSYDSESIDYDGTNSETIYTSINTSVSCSRPSQTNFSQQSVGTRKLSSIETNNYKITFDRTAGRLDVSGASRLNAVNIWKKRGGLLYNIKHIVLDNDQYFGSENDNKRLKLDALDFYPSVQNLNDGLNYTFTYNETIELPERTSYAKDHWGYYNGASNLGLVPEIEYGGEILSGADRSVNDTYSLTYLMKKIKYPTKGYTEFEFESNQYFINENYYDDFIVQINETDVPATPVNPVNSEYFTITHDQTVALSVVLDYDESVPVGDGSGGYVKIEDTNGNVVFSVGGGEEIDDLFDVSLDEGNYYLRTYNTDIGGTSFDIQVDYEKDMGIYPKQYLVGGARIKQIIDNPIDGPSVTTSYFYDPYDIELFNDPSPNSYTYDLCEPLPESPQQCECTFLVRSSSSRFFGSSQSIGYKVVHEVKGETEDIECDGDVDNPFQIDFPYDDFCANMNGSIGKTTYHYLAGSSYGAGGWPFTPRMTKSWKQATLLQKDVFDSEGVKLEEVKNSYHFPAQDTVRGLVIGKVKAPALGSFDNFVANTEFTQIYYEYVSEPVYLTNRVTHKDGVVTEEFFEYNNEFLMSEHKTVVHNQEDTVVKKIRYASDFGASGTQYDLIANNFISIPLEVTEWKNGQLTQSKFDLYRHIIISGSYEQILKEGQFLYDLNDESKDETTSTSLDYVLDDGYYEALKIDYEQYLTANVFQPFYQASGYETPHEKKEFFRNNAGEVLAVFSNTDRDYVQYVNFESDNSSQSYQVLSGSQILDSFEGANAFNGEILIEVDEPASSGLSITIYAKSDNASSTIDVGGVSVSITDSWRAYRIDLPWDVSGLEIDSNGNDIDAIAVYPAESTVQTFSYDLFGIVRETDANGKSVSYSYDPMGRLELIRDHEGNILKKFQYNYAD